MEYISLTQEERDMIIAREVHARELEHFQYSLNAARYDDMLVDMADIPDEWPDELKEHKKLATREDIVKKLAATPEVCQAVLALQFRDRIRHLAMTEKYEMAKVERIHAKVLSALPKDEQERGILLNKVKTERGG